MKILIACEFSGIVRDAFIKKGHDAVSCDLLPTERPGPHIQGDCIPLLNRGWDMIIAFPVCTYLCNSGVRWLYNDGKGKVKNYERWGKMYAGVLFFNDILDANCKKIVVENPIMCGHAQDLIQDDGYLRQNIQPWQHGHGETKATSLRIKGLSLLKPSNIVNGREARIHKMAPSKNRGKLRSITYQGIADAMAAQWG